MKPRFSFHQNFEITAEVGCIFVVLDQLLLILNYLKSPPRFLFWNFAGQLYCSRMWTRRILERKNAVILYLIEKTKSILKVRATLSRKTNNDICRDSQRTCRSADPADGSEITFPAVTTPHSA